MRYVLIFVFIFFGSVSMAECTRYGPNSGPLHLCNCVGDNVEDCCKQEWEKKKRKNDIECMKEDMEIKALEDLKKKKDNQRESKKIKLKNMDWSIYKMFREAEKMAENPPKKICIDFRADGYPVLAKCKGLIMEGNVNRYKVRTEDNPKNPTLKQHIYILKRRGK